MGRARTYAGVDMVPLPFQELLMAGDAMQRRWDYNKMLMNDAYTKIADTATRNVEGDRNKLADILTGFENEKQDLISRYEGNFSDPEFMASTEELVRKYSRNEDLKSMMQIKAEKDKADEMAMRMQASGKGLVYNNRNLWDESLYDEEGNRRDLSEFSAVGSIEERLDWNSKINEMYQRVKPDKFASELQQGKFGTLKHGDVLTNIKKIDTLNESQQLMKEYLLSREGNQHFRVLKQQGLDDLEAIDEIAAEISGMGEKYKMEAQDIRRMTDPTLKSNKEDNPTGSPSFSPLIEIPAPTISVDENSGSIRNLLGQGDKSIFEYITSVGQHKQSTDPNYELYEDKEQSPERSQFQGDIDNKLDNFKKVNPKLTDKQAMEGLKKMIKDYPKKESMPVEEIEDIDERRDESEKFFDPASGGGDFQNKVILTNKGEKIKLGTYLNNEFNIDISDPKDRKKFLEGGFQIIGKLKGNNAFGPKGKQATFNNETFYILENPDQRLHEDRVAVFEFNANRHRYILDPVHSWIQLDPNPDEDGNINRVRFTSYYDWDSKKAVKITKEILKD